MVLLVENRYPDGFKKIKKTKHTSKITFKSFPVKYIHKHILFSGTPAGDLIESPAGIISYPVWQIAFNMPDGRNRVTDDSRQQAAQGGDGKHQPHTRAWTHSTDPAKGL